LPVKQAERSRKIASPVSQAIAGDESPAGSPLLRSVPAFAGLSSCHWHDEFAYANRLLTP